MLLAFAIDLVLIIFLENSRHAIHTAEVPPHPFVTFHVSLAVITLVLYFAQIVGGFFLAAGNQRIRYWHRFMAYLFIGFRLSVFITSLWIENFIPKE